LIASAEGAIGFDRSLSQITAHVGAPFFIPQPGSGCAPHLRGQWRRKPMALAA
jgi:hypothetical protein